MAYLYRHIRLDKNVPFYIGIGNDDSYKRAYSKYKRNKYWKSIVSKTIYDIEILMDNLTWENACIKEKEFISLYGRKNNNTGILSNMTDGGEGTLGIVFNNDRRNKISLKNINNKYNSGNKHSEETKLIISNKIKNILKANHPLKGKNHSIIAKTKIAKSKECKPFKVFKNGILVNIYDVQSICANELNINRCAINMCLKGIRKQTGGYTFIYS